MFEFPSTLQQGFKNEKLSSENKIRKWFKHENFKDFDELQEEKSDQEQEIDVMAIPTTGVVHVLVSLSRTNVESSLTHVNTQLLSNNGRPHSPTTTD